MKYLIGLLMFCTTLVLAGTKYESNPLAPAVKSGLTDIQSCKSNVLDALDKLDIAHIGITNSLAEWQALSGSATKNAGVDTVKATRDLSQATKQLAQAVRDLMQAIKKMNMDGSP